MQDLRYAFRGLLRNPGFAAVAVLTLALGIGANAAIFSVVHAVLLRPLPYPEADRLVSVLELPVGQSETVVDVAYLDWADWRREVQGYDDLAAYASSSGGLVVEIENDAETLEGKLVTWNLMSLLGVAPLSGRLLEEADDRLGAERVALISEGLWRRRFGAEPETVGRTIRIGGEAHRIVGILPAGVEFPLGASLWLPVVPALDPMFTEQRTIGFLNLIGRLAPGVTAAQAKAELDAVIERVSNPLRGENQATRAELYPFAEALVGDTRTPLSILWAAAALVFLIACANVANLQLVRGLARRREVAIRAALGAGRARRMRLSLIEGAVLAAAGGVAGLALARWGLAAVMAWSPVTLFRQETIAVDGAVFGFGLALAAIIALASGLLPLVEWRGLRLGEQLREGAGRSTAGAGHRRLLGAAVVAQVTLALVLLIGAGLLLRSLTRLHGLDVGFDRERTLTVALALLADEHGKPEVAHPLFDRMIERVEALPGVESAAGTLRRPLESPLGFDARFTLEGRPPDEQATYPHLNYLAVTPGYFETLGTPLREGRPFSGADRAGSPPVAIVSAATARRFWGSESPIGRRLKFGAPDSAGDWVEIVGVAGEVRSRVIESVSLDVYVPHRQSNWPLRNLVLRVAGEPLAVASAVRRELRAVDPDVRVSEIATAGDLVARSTARPRFHTLLVAVFGALALSIGAVGIYGVLAHSMALRRRELGVRMALGATPGDVLRLALGAGLRQAAMGVGLGLAVAFAASRVLASVLFEISTRDVVTFVAAPAVLLAVAVVACLVPAWRASRVDPLEVLR